MNNIPSISEALLHVDDDKLADYLMVEHAKDKMLKKLAKKREDGRGNWYHPTQCSNATLIELLKNHIDKGDMVDVLNLAAMILMRNVLHNDETILKK
jgi:hypothetical protein